MSDENIYPGKQGRSDSTLMILTSTGGLAKLPPKTKESTRTTGGSGEQARVLGNL